MKNKLMNLLIILCFIVGLVLILVNPIQNFLIERASNRLVEEIVIMPPPSEDSPQVVVQDDANVTEASEQEDTEEVSFDFEEVQSLSIWDVLEAQTKVKNMPAVGSIHIPSVNMTLPILNGVGKYALAVGAGTMKRSQKMGEGNYALASHYIEGKNVLFGPLYHLKVGDSIYLSDSTYMYEYKTIAIDVIKATDVHVIEDIANKNLLTLITCADEGTRRLSVVAELVGKSAETAVASSNR